MDNWGACGGHLDATESCPEEPFLHALHSCDECGSTIASFTCTKHAGVLHLLPIVDYNGTPQVHEVDETCLDPEAVWDVEENCCVVEEDEPVLDPEIVRAVNPFHV